MGIKRVKSQSFIKLLEQFYFDTAKGLFCVYGGSYLYVQHGTYLKWFDKEIIKKIQFKDHNICLVLPNGLTSWISPEKIQYKKIYLKKEIEWAKMFSKSYKAYKEKNG